MTPERQKEARKLARGDRLAIQPNGSAHGRALQEALDYITKLEAVLKEAAKPIWQRHADRYSVSLTNGHLLEVGGYPFRGYYRDSLLVIELGEP